MKIGLMKWMAAGVALIAVSVPVHATVITFDGPFELAFEGDTITRQGFDFTLNSPPGTSPFLEVGNARDLGGLFNANGARFDMAASGGGAFNLSSFEIARRENDTTYTRSAADVEIVGVLLGGGTVTHNTGALNLGFAVVTLPNTFVNLVSVGFNPTINSTTNRSFDYEFLIDNINTEVAAAVPEPASIALLGVGIAGIVVSRRRKSKGC